MKFDICIPTRNSGKYIARCLEGIKITFEDKINRLIIVDGYSSDDTIEIIKKWKDTLPIRLFFSRDKLGKVRELMIKKVRTPWFFFIDSDVVVNRRWFRKILSSIDKKTGAVQGFALSSNFLLSRIRKRKIPERGFTSNTLIRTSLVRDISLPNIKRGEDDLIKKHIEAKGYKWKYVDVYCQHLKPVHKILQDFVKDFTIFWKREGLKKAINI